MSRLVYKRDVRISNGQPLPFVNSERIGETPPEGWIRGELKSATICATDRSNLHGRLAHRREGDEGILGHECCYYVKDSWNNRIRKGQYFVPLGDDWLGFAERQLFFPVLEGTLTTEYLVRATDRHYWDPSPPSVRAVCILDEWFSGASLIEPFTHVYTAFRGLKLLQSGKKILVLGAGLCGQAACFIAKQHAYSDVCVLDRSAHRLELASRSRHADWTIRVADDGAIADERAVEMVGAVDADPLKTAGFDIVFDALPAGSDAERPCQSRTRTHAAQLLRPGGAWLMYSAAENMELPSLLLVAKGIAVCNAPYDHRVISFQDRAKDMTFVCDNYRNELGRFLDEQKTIAFCDEQSVRHAIEDSGSSGALRIEIVRYCTGEADSPETYDEGSAKCTECKATRWGKR